MGRCGKPSVSVGQSRGQRALTALGLACIAALASATPALAQTTVIAGPSPYTYQNPDVTIDRGGALNFQNLDFSAPHDVTSLEAGAHNGSLFRSETIDAPETVPVEGADAAPPGSYDFICSVHPFMTGTLTVRGEDGGGGLELKVRPLDSRIEPVLEAGKLRARVKLSEAARLRLRASEKRDGKDVVSGRSRVSKGSSRVAAKLTRSGERLLRRALKAGQKVRLTLEAKAHGESGGTAEESVGITLR